MEHKNNPSQMTHHHIVPRSRQKKNGIAIVPRVSHENYHNLFGNMTPQEIVSWLNATFWNNLFHITIKKRPPP